jgi:hypothetical protein
MSANCVSPPVLCDAARAQERIFHRTHLERLVGVPAAAAEIVHAPRVAGVECPAVLADVGRVGHEPGQAPVAFFGQVLHRFLQVAERRKERDLLLVREILAMQHQHGIAGDRILDGLDRCRVGRDAQIEAFDFGGRIPGVIHAAGS